MMITVKINTGEVFALLNDTSTRLLQVISSFTEEEMQVVVSKHCWTAAQVSEHIIRVIRSLAEAIHAKGKIAEREPDQRVAEIRDLFLDFTQKFKSPEVVLPIQVGYKKEMIIYDFKKSIEHVRELGKTVNLFETAEVPGFGILTNLELLYFVVYHTQRHIIQLENIRDRINR